MSPQDTKAATAHLLVQSRLAGSQAEAEKKVEKALSRQNNIDNSKR